MIFYKLILFSFYDNIINSDKYKNSDYIFNLSQKVKK